jgi:acetoin utilization deacetylase AcuC-like enzyme
MIFVGLCSFSKIINTAGFDGYISDPLGGQLCLSLEDYKTATKMVIAVSTIV